VGKQGEMFFLAGPGKHRWQAGEHVAEVDPGIMAVALAGGQEAEMDRCCAAAALPKTLGRLSKRLTEGREGAKVDS
jgi:hypothetical protein